METGRKNSLWGDAFGHGLTSLGDHQSIAGRWTCRKSGAGCSNGPAGFERGGDGGHPGAGPAMVRAINPGVLAAWIRILISGKRTDSGKVRDIMRLKRGNPDHLPVKAFMSRPVHTISPCKHPGSGATDGKTRHRSIAGGGRRTTYRYYNTIRCNGPLLRPLSPRWPS